MSDDAVTAAAVVVWCVIVAGAFLFSPWVGGAVIVVTALVLWLADRVEPGDDLDEYDPY